MSAFMQQSRPLKYIGRGVTCLCRQNVGLVIIKRQDTIANYDENIFGANMVTNDAVWFVADMDGANSKVHIQAYCITERVEDITFIQRHRRLPLRRSTDEIRDRRKERLQRTFPNIDVDGIGPRAG
jgi:hypothetical protein